MHTSMTCRRLRAILGLPLISGLLVLGGSALAQPPPYPQPRAPTPLEPTRPVPADPRLRRQPVAPPDLRLDPRPPAPQLNPCTQTVYSGGVKIDLAAVATGPSSVALTWQGLPGEYQVRSTQGSGFSTVTRLSAPAGAPPAATIAGAVTDTGAQPNAEVRYAIDATLADGRKACGGATVKTPPAPAVIVAQPLPPPVIVGPAPLSGWVDLHTHPMINLAFGGKLVHGGVDVGALLPTDVNCKFRVNATSIEHALGSDKPSHGGWNLIHAPCGDDLRKLLINKFQDQNGALTTASPAMGFPDFDQWPKWNDITHQKMWFEWVRRARDGGLRVMVALATNNKTLADAMSGPNDLPTDDRTSADLQIIQIKAFVDRHPDFMAIALNAADVDRIVRSNRIAVVLGVEIDDIGNFNKSRLASLNGDQVKVLISDEIQRLYVSGVRYIFPIHVIDNHFGGTAIYENGFNTSNHRESGHFWSIECSLAGDGITHQYAESGFLDTVARDAVAAVKIGVNPFHHAGPGPVCPPAGQAGVLKGSGHRNARGLSSIGEVAIREMMKRGMLIDIDHMSQKAADATLALAEIYDYPLLSGHSAIRGVGGANAENSRTPAQLLRLSKLYGMFGLGSEGIEAHQWARQYQQAVSAMGYMHPDPAKANYRNGAVAFGTDLNGLVKGPRPSGVNRVVYSPSFPMSNSGTKFWNYNTEGVAHYGMMADFVRDVRTAPSFNYYLDVSGEKLVDNHLFAGAGYFHAMWRRIEARKSNVP